MAGMRGGRKRRAAVRPSLLAVSVAACFAVSAHDAHANPSGPSVVSGNASFAASGSTLTITNSANAVINWQSFSIGVNEITRFVQPSAAAAVLNRVTGTNGVIPQSVIDGMLQSNGHVYLLNRSGIVFGKSARIDVAGLVASSLDLGDDDFVNKRNRFFAAPGAGAVVNHGVIQTAAGGKVYLVAPDVQNSGIIRAPQGEIILAAGKSAELVSESSPYVTVKLEADTERALNVGSLIADAGRIGMFGALVRHSGIADASAAVIGDGGQVRFVATKDLTLDANSRVAANGANGGEVFLQAKTGINSIEGVVEATGASGKGGKVSALGVRVGVLGQGVIDASGETGGGTVLVGGDYQGKSPEVQNAQRTVIGADGVIRADARSTGDGGRVIVWADGDTFMAGSISARGGSQSGNGGFVETSGKQSLSFTGRVDASAPHGAAGTLLLDPEDIVIADLPDGGGQEDSLVRDGIILLGDLPGLAITISAGALEALTSDVNIDLMANRSITMQPLTRSQTPGSLTLDQIGFVRMTTNTGPLDLGTGNTINLTGTGRLELKAGTDLKTGPITTSGGSVLLTARTGNVVTGAITTASLKDGFSGGSVDVLTDTGNISIGGTIDTSGAAGNAYGGSVSGSSGGSVRLWRKGATLPGSISVQGNIVTRGGDGATPFSGNGGNGGPGGTVEIGGAVDTCGNGCYKTTAMPGTIAIAGLIDTRGGVGGSGAALGGAGGIGGSAGAMALLALDGVSIAGGIIARGGSGAAGATGGTSGPGQTAGGDGGAGTAGGAVFVQAANGTVTIGGPIDVDGGSGGNGGAQGGGPSAGSGGAGAAGGIVDLEGKGVVAGNITAKGGGGGNAGSNGTAGGGAAGGVVATSGAGSVGDVSANAGAGGSAPGGGTAGAGAYGGTIIVGSNATGFLSALGTGPGDGTITLGSSGNLDVGGASAATTIIAATGAVTQSGVISSASLGVTGGSVTLALQNNVSVLGGQATAGDFVFRTSGSVVLTGVAAKNLASITSSYGGIAGAAALYAVEGAAVALNAGGALGAAGSPLNVRAATLDARATGGLHMNLNTFAPAFATINTLMNSGSGELVLNAYGGAHITNPVSNPGGSVFISSFSPLRVDQGIVAGDSIALATLGADATPGANDMVLRGTYSYAASGTFAVTVGPSGVLDIVDGVLSAELFPNTPKITSFTFIASNPLSNPLVLQAAGTTVSTAVETAEGEKQEEGENRERRSLGTCRPA